jgi:CRISPR/Cas system-associated exonuclease Cas4 (RecB family)
MSNELTPFLLQHAPWSLSKVESVKQCPRKFWYSYCNKPDKTALGIVDNYDARVGKAIHKALEHLINGQSLDRAFQFACDEFRLVTRELEAVNAARPAAEHFLSMFNSFRHAKGKHELLTEAKISCGFKGEKRPYFDKRGTPNTILLRGVIDVGCIFLDAPTAIIVDHKTGKNKGIANHAHQMDCYALLLKANYPRLTKMIPAIHWVQDKKVELGTPIELSDLDSLRHKVVQFMLEATAGVDASKLETTRVGILCNWCDYQALCPEHSSSLSGANVEIQEEVRDGVSSIGLIEGLNT